MFVAFIHLVIILRLNQLIIVNQFKFYFYNNILEFI